MEELKNEDKTRVFALLIDGDNVSPKYITAIMQEVTARYGSLSFRRIYGDFTTSQKNSWKSVLLEHSITPIQQYNNTVGKNSSDSALIIDAMDILYTGKVDGFCIVSSDGDFTRLASRLRESQMYVIVMGEEKTPRSIRMACDKFITLENLIESYDDKKTAAKKKAQVLPKINVIDAITDIIADNDNSGRETHLGELGSKLSSRYPDFDTRDYGYSSLSKFIEETAEFKLYKKNSASYVKVYDRSQQAEDVRDYALKLITSAGSKGIKVGDLSNKLHLKFPAFTPKTYGYSQFTKFVDALPGITVITAANDKVAILETIKSEAKNTVTAIDKVTSVELPTVEMATIEVPAAEDALSEAKEHIEEMEALYAPLETEPEVSAKPAKASKTSKASKDKKPRKPIVRKRKAEKQPN